MRFLYVTDLHLRASAPVRRLDSWPEACLAKLRWVVELAREEACDFVLCGGDLFDGPRPPMGLIAEVARIVSGGPRWLCVLGNHDEVGHSPETALSSAVGLLDCLGCFEILGGIEGSSAVFRDGPEPEDRSGGVVLWPFHYYHGIDLRDSFEVVDMLGADVRVVAPHAMLLPEPAPFDHVLIEDVEVGCADLVLCSHYHQPFSVTRDDGVVFVNPGPLCRLSIAEADHRPAVLVVDCGGGGVEVKRRRVPCGGPEVWDHEAAERDRDWSGNIDEFLRSMESGVVKGADLADRVGAYAEATGVEPEVVELVLEVVDEIKGEA